MTVEDAPKAGGSESRELKVKVPLALHVHLHSLRILKGTSISAVVTDALAQYFDGPGSEDLFTAGPGASPRRRGDED